MHAKASSTSCPSKSWEQRQAMQRYCENHRKIHCTLHVSAEWKRPSWSGTSMRTPPLCCAPMQTPPHGSQLQQFALHLTEGQLKKCAGGRDVYRRTALFIYKKSFIVRPQVSVRRRECR